MVVRYRHVFDRQMDTRKRHIYTVKCILSVFVSVRVTWHIHAQGEASYKCIMYIYDLTGLSWRIHVPRRGDHYVHMTYQGGAIITHTMCVCMANLTWLRKSSGGLTNCPLPNCLWVFYKAEARLASSGLVGWSVRNLALGLIHTYICSSGESY